MPLEDESVSHARIACIECRRGKRRCDRKIPSCNLCIRKQVECSYPGRRNGNQELLASRGSTCWMPSSLSPEGPSRSQEHNQSYISNSGLSDPTESNTNAIYFLAPGLYQQARLSLPRPDLPIPTDVSLFMGDTSSIRRIASSFFTHIHRWLPIISKRDFFASLLSPLGQRRTEFSLLIICMKLCSNGPSSDYGDSSVKTKLYRTAKRFHYEAESAGIMSIHVLQAGILIALYEIGQAIYPSAYLSVGACARYGLALGIDKFALASTGESHGQRPWNEMEEGKRVWWAVLMFDRFLSLSNSLRPLSTQDPTFDTYLPVDDEAWGNSTAKPGEAVQISTGFLLKMGSFARLAQGTYLLSQALRSINPTTTGGEVTHKDKTAQLRRTLLALVHATDSEVTVRRLEFCAQSALSLSTILLLQEHHMQERLTNHDEEDARLSFETLWPETNISLDRLVSAAVSCNTTCVEDSHAPDNVPVFVVHAMYQVACMFLVHAQVDQNDDSRDKIEEVKRWLRLISPRWRLAGVYLNILEARELAMSLDIFDMPSSIS